jgi:hypothetical protein
VKVVVCAARPAIDQDQGNACTLFFYVQGGAADIDTLGIKVESGVEASNFRDVQYDVLDMDDLVQHRLPCRRIQAY